MSSSLSALPSSTSLPNPTTNSTTTSSATTTTTHTPLTPRDPNTSSPTKTKSSSSSSSALFQGKAAGGGEGEDMDVMKEEGKSYEINVVGDKDVLKSEDRIGGGGQQAQAQNHSMEFHRKVLEKRLGEQGGQKQSYISPSDTIMSPCTAKLSAYKSKHFLKAKPQSLLGKFEAAQKTNTSANANANVSIENKDL